VEYKKGVDNKVADALSRRNSEAEDISLSLLSLPVLGWVDDLKAQYLVDPKLQLFLTQWHTHELSTQKYSLRDGILLYKNRIILGDSPHLKAQVLLYVHSDPMAGHVGYEKTLQRAKRDFYWQGMRRDIKAFIRQCDTCQMNKHDNTYPAGVLQPLPIPSRVWTDISMDFVEGLPLSQGYSVIFVVVDRLSKYANFMALSHPYSAARVAQIFVANVFKLHGMPNSIVSDRDTTFTSTFWSELFRLQGTTLKLSTNYHPQTDGQTEIVNKALKNYLRCFTQDSPKNWSYWLPWAEYSYNTSWHSSTKLTPFEVVYGVPPPRLLTYIPGTTRVQAVDEVLRNREQILSILNHNLKQAQQRMKKYADIRCNDPPPMTQYCPLLAPHIRLPRRSPILGLLSQRLA
jgi:hypothetical protein